MKSLTVDIDGPVHVVDHGGDGQVMLLVHGIGGSHVDWNDVGPGLAASHHVYAVDLLGFGRTPLGHRHAQLGDQWRLVDALIDRLSPGAPVVLVGNSMGGLVSLVETAKRPRKIAALVLVDPALPRPGPRRMLRTIEIAFITVSLPGIGAMVVDRRRRLVSTERIVDEALALCTVDPARINPATRRAQVDLQLWREEHSPSQRAFIEGAKSLVRWLWNREDVYRYARAVTAPTLLVHGTRDRVVSPRNARALESLRPDWSFHWFEDIGHVPQMERPDEFLQVVGAWLAGLETDEQLDVELAASG